MRNYKFPILVIFTVAFAAFTLGLVIGRTQNQGAISVNVPQRLLTEPTQEPLQETEFTVETEGISFPIDINSANTDEFMALPGIGDVLAQRILTYREENGTFNSVEELLNVEGIGKKKLEEIWDLITIGG